MHELGYQGITLNVGNSDAQRSRSARTRACARPSSSRSTARPIIEVVDGRRGRAGNQWVPPGEPLLRARTSPVPKRDVARAKQLLKEAGVPDPVHARMTSRTTRTAAQVARGDPGDGEGGRLRREDPAHRVRHLAAAGRQGRLRGLRARPGAAAPTRTATSTASTPASSALNDTRLLQRRVDELLNEARAGRGPGASARSSTTRSREMRGGPADRLPVPPARASSAYSTKLQGCAPVPDGLIRAAGPEAAN